jgi:hypothetical protein
MPARRAGEKPAHQVVIEAIAKCPHSGEAFTVHDLVVPKGYEPKTVAATLARAALHGPGARWDERWQYVQKIETGLYRYVGAIVLTETENTEALEPVTTTYPARFDWTRSSSTDAVADRSVRRPATVGVEQAQFACHAVMADMDAAGAALQQSAETAETEIAALYVAVARAHWEAAKARLDILLRTPIRDE